MGQAFRILLASGFALALVATHSFAQATRLETESGVITYEVLGRGSPTLVFIHCWTCDMKSWRHQAARFSTAHRVLLVDLPGHGRSASDKGTFSIAGYAKSVARLLDADDADHYILVGHSMGGPIAYEVNERIPSKVVAIVGVDTFNLGEKVPQGEERARFFREFDHDYQHAAVKLSEKMFVSQTPEHVRREVQQYFVSAIQPVAVQSLRSIFAWYEDHAPGKIAERIGGKLWNINAGPPPDSADHASVGRTLYMEHVGHFPAQERPERFNQALRQVLTEIADKQANR